MKIKAKYKSYGYLNKYWAEGEVMEINDPDFHKNPEAKHFDVLGAAAEKSAPVQDGEPRTMSEAQKQQGERPNAGMAHDPRKPGPKRK